MSGRVIKRENERESPTEKERLRKREGKKLRKKLIVKRE